MFNIYINYNKDKEITYIGVTKLNQKQLIEEQKEKGLNQYVEIAESYEDYNEAQKRKNYMVEFYRPKYMMKGGKKRARGNENLLSSRKNDRGNSKIYRRNAKGSKERFNSGRKSSFRK